jgi:pterin-4a-carbinolamine dehydratase
VRTTTHDAGGLTARDAALVAAIAALAADAPR